MLENTSDQVQGIFDIVTKFHELLSTNGIQLDRSFYPTLSILFRPESIAHTLSGINVAPHGESKWNDVGFVCNSDSKTQKDFNSAVASRRAALSGNTSLIAYNRVFVHIKILMLCIADHA